MCHIAATALKCQIIRSLFLISAGRTEQSLRSFRLGTMSDLDNVSSRRCNSGDDEEPGDVANIA